MTRLKFGREAVVNEQVYTIEQPNSCDLKFNVPLSLVNDLNNELKKDHELSGIIVFDDNNQVIGLNKTKGEADSVYTPNNVINFHTHPSSAYNKEHTVWGWPSGEDLRESIKFALAGNRAHLVFSVEGLYTIQFSPCKIKKMKELLTDEERGALIFIIEEFFKSTHNFRGTNEVNKLAKRGIIINPYSYMDFVNTFDLANLLNEKTVIHREVPTESTKNIGHTGIHGDENVKLYSFGESDFSRIPNVGFPNVEGSRIRSEPMSDYIDSSDLKEARKIDDRGEELGFRIKNIEQLKTILKGVFEKFEQTQCEIKWNNNKNAWFFVNFFPSDNYGQQSYLDGQTYKSPDPEIDVVTSVEPFIRIFSNKQEGCSINDMTRTSKFKIGKFNFIKKCCGFGGHRKSPNKILSGQKRLKRLYNDLERVTGRKTNKCGAHRKYESPQQGTTRFINPNPALELIEKQYDLEYLETMSELNRQAKQMNLNRQNGEVFYQQTKHKSQSTLPFQQQFKVLNADPPPGWRLIGRDERGNQIFQDPMGGQWVSNYTF